VASESAAVFLCGCVAVVKAIPRVKRGNESFCYYSKATV